MRIVSMVVLSRVIGALSGCGDDGAAGGAGATTAGPTSGSQSSGPGSGPTTGSSASSVAGSGSGSGATVSTSASATTDASASASGDASSSSMALPMCDDDGDGYDQIGPGCASMMDPAADCDDDDADVHPMQSAWFTSPRASVADPVLRWDYDCDGTAAKEWVHHTNPCGAILGLCNQSGDSFNGAQDAYDCGVAGTVTNCTAVVGGCNALPATLGCH